MGPAGRADAQKNQKDIYLWVSALFLDAVSVFWRGKGREQ